MVLDSAIQKLLKKYKFFKNYVNELINFDSKIIILNILYFQNQ